MKFRTSQIISNDRNQNSRWKGCVNSPLKVTAYNDKIVLCLDPDSHYMGGRK